MSIFLANGSTPAKLEEIIAAADAMNHAIPRKNEFSESFGKLLAIGVIHISDNEFCIEPDHTQSITKAYDGRGGLFETPNKGRVWLNRAHATVPQDYSRVELSDQN